MKKNNIFDGKLVDYENDFNWKLYEHIPRNKKILDIGCSTGQMGKYLIDNKNAVVFGVDISPKAIKKASHVLHKTACIDIENEKIPFKELFDVALFGDVLEHLYDPISTLERVKTNLKKNSLLICSIPNIANIEIRFKLLFGMFEYKKSGILDESHIRFFTLKSIKKMFEELNFSIIKIDYTPSPFILSGNKIIRNVTLRRKINYFLSSMRVTLFARQFIIVAKAI